MKAQELSEKTKEELTTLLQEKQVQLTEMRFKVSARQHKNYREIGEVKKDIARILTRLNESKE